jgi:ribonuclease HII
MLKLKYSENKIEAGCDEAGRGCLAGPVFAAAVILPGNFENELLNDSKKISEKNRYKLREIIEKEAIAFAVAQTDCKTIDKINILQAAILTMQKAVLKLNTKPQMLLIDGNKFNKMKNYEHKCIIGGDGKYMAIAAASILAKTYRDDFMKKIHQQHPEYDWFNNKGYGTKKHQQAILKHGFTQYHRKTFNFKMQQMTINF